MSDLVTQYQNTYTELMEAEQRASAIAASIRSLAGTVGNDWKRVKVAGAKGLPDTLILTPNAPSISPEDWPAFADLRDAVSAYHTSKLALNNLWLNIPKTEKDALRPPPRT